MKALFYSFLLLFISSLSYGQEAPIGKLPIDSTVNKVRIFKEVILDRIVIRDTMWDIEQDEVHHRANYWFKSFFKNPKNVVIQNEKYSIIKGRHKYRLYNIDPKSGTRTVGAFLNYDVTILCEKGKFTLIIDNMRKHQSNPQPVEKWINEKGEAYPDFNTWTLQLEAYLKEITIDVDRTMAKSPNDQK